jgi:serine/threonine-protein kinase
MDADERDQRLARLLAELSDQARAGHRPDIDAIAARHPDLAAELRPLWGAVLFADELIRDDRPLPARSASKEQPLLARRAAEEHTSSRTFGDYELLEELGRGGMGVVYRARQRSLNRPVALKMILRGELATPEDLARFRTEAQAAANLEHPNIVPVYDAGEHDGQAYFSMRFVEGQTLAELLARGPLRPRDAARYLAAIARAVHHAHEHGILHRDLKPSNILLDSDDQPHITDFGLAKRVSGQMTAVHTATGAIVGTPAYMAPEQVSNRRGVPSRVSDVYSLGVILYEMLTGRPPFQAPTPVDTLLLVLDQDPVPPRLLNPGVDADLEMICLKCIQKEPELRYRSARALAEDLDAYLHGETVSVRSGRLASVFNRTFRETPHAVVLENFGLLWMCHSVLILLMCSLTTWLAYHGVENPLWYLLLWGGGLIVWATVFWELRTRAGPVLFIDRQVAHVWGGAIAATIGVFVIEYLLHMPVLSLAPMLAVIAGITFAVKAGMLSGTFYFSAAAEFLTAIPMSLPPLYRPYGVLLFGVVTAGCFFVPGLKYHRQRLRTQQRTTSAAEERGGSTDQWGGCSVSG